MVSLDDAVVARLARFGTTFEILVDPEESEHWVNGDQPDSDVTEIMAVDDVFVDWSEGERAPKDKLQEAFDTTDIGSIARRILDEGEIQLTSEQRKRMLESKHKRIITTIAREAWNPQTKNPHPYERLERALGEAKWRADPLRRVEEQVNEAMKKLKPLLPIAFERIKVAIKIPAEHTGPAYGVIRTLGDLKKEEWQSDGAFVCVLEIPAGAQTEVYDRLNGVTQGSVETRLI